MKKKAPRPKSATTEGRAGSKEGRKAGGGTRRQARLSVNDDDGTQMEQAPKKVGGTKRARAAAKGQKTEDAFTNALRSFALATAEIGVPQLVKEFAEMRQKDLANVPAKTAFDANADKNRYRDVICIDESRVVLTWPPGNTNEYVHANYVPCKATGEKKFICTQGPTANTVDDFWRLVWQEKAKAIVMLCGVTEQGKPKCEQYWPEKLNETTSVACGLKITNTEISEAEKTLTISKLELKFEAETLTVIHYLWNSWPDRGVPENFMACLRLLTKLKPFCPVVVHCSAGIGRTGTIVGLQAAMNVLENGDKPLMSEILKDIRSHRHGSVQTDIQYVYIHRVLIGFAENKKAIKKEEVEQFFKDYETLLKARGCG